MSSESILVAKATAVQEKHKDDTSFLPLRTYAPISLLAVLRVAQDRNLHKHTKDQTSRIYLSTFLQTHARFCIQDLKVDYTAGSQEYQPDVVLEKANTEQYTRR